ncbi:DUF167 domain-containing protein [archaeon]|nr:MAG: DUF167 domain-containing protein [archaeon]
MSAGAGAAGGGGPAAATEFAFVTLTKSGVVQLAVDVRPGAASNEVCVSHEALLVRTSEPPRDGAANEGVIKQIAHALRVPKSACALVAGSKGRHKVLQLKDTRMEDVVAVLRSLASA